MNTDRCKIKHFKMQNNGYRVFQIFQEGLYLLKDKGVKFDLFEMIKDFRIYQEKNNTFVGNRLLYSENILDSQFQNDWNRPIENVNIDFVNSKRLIYDDFERKEK